MLGGFYATNQPVQLSVTFGGPSRNMSRGESVPLGGQSEPGVLPTGYSSTPCSLLGAAGLRPRDVAAGVRQAGPTDLPAWTASCAGKPPARQHPCKHEAAETCAYTTGIPQWGPPQQERLEAKATDPPEEMEYRPCGV